VVGTVKLVVGSAVLVLVALLARGWRPLARLVTEPGLRGWALLAALSTAVYQAAFFTSVARTGVVLGTVVAIGSAPVFNGMLARWLSGERLSLRWMAATAMAVAGTVILLYPGKADTTDVLGIVLALVAGLTYALYTNTAKRLLNRGVEIVPLLAATLGLGAILLLPILFTGSTPALLEPAGLLLVLWIGVVTTAAAYLLFARGLRRLPAATVGTLGLAEPLTATLLGLLLLSERPSARAVLGAGLVLVGLLLLTLQRRPAEAARI
jgi:DME family drug/metabolite transporter